MHDGTVVRVCVGGCTFILCVPLLALGEGRCACIACEGAGYGACSMRVGR